MALFAAAESAGLSCCADVRIDVNRSKQRAIKERFSMAVILAQAKVELAFQTVRTLFSSYQKSRVELAFRPASRLPLFLSSRPRALARAKGSAVRAAERRHEPRHTLFTPVPCDVARFPASPGARGAVATLASRKSAGRLRSAAAASGRRRSASTSCPGACDSRDG